MERWSNKVVLITGASAGIGRCLTECLVSKGMTVVGVARRVDRIKQLAEELKSKPGKLFPLQCDLSNQNDILRVLEWTEKNLGAVHILINNAATNIDVTMYTGEMDNWRKTFDVNMLGLTCMTKEVLKLMKKKGIDNGVIVNINDVCGLRMSTTCDRPMSPAYISSKCALTALTECLRSELAQSINPGLVDTEMTAQWLRENPRLALKPKDVSDCVIFALQTPDTVLIRDLTVTPIHETM